LDACIFDGVRVLRRQRNAAQQQAQQHDIARMRRAGHTNEEIARAIGKTRRTVYRIMAESSKVPA